MTTTRLMFGSVVGLFAMILGATCLWPGENAPAGRPVLTIVMFSFGALWAFVEVCAACYRAGRSSRGGR